MPQSEFDIACKARGFKRCKTTYARCIGDGVLQILFVGGRTYISPHSPYYSSSARKSNYLSIGLWSMYSNLPEFLFEPGAHAGQFTVENFRGNKFIEFMGIIDDHRFMLEKGLNLLDTIQTQESLIQVAQSLYTAEFGGVGPAQIDLCEPLLKCGRYTEALDRVGSFYASQWVMFHQSANTLSLDEYRANEGKMLSKTRKIADIWRMIATNNHEDIEEYLKSNYEQNIGFTEKYKIPFHSVSNSTDLLL